MAGGSRKEADQLVITALAAGMTRKGAAEAAGVSEGTIYRRLKDAAFRQQVQDARAEMIERASGVLAASAGDAALTLHRLLKSPNPSIQLGAARSILSLLLSVREQVDLQSELAELKSIAETLQEGKGHGNPFHSAA